MNTITKKKNEEKKATSIKKKFTDFFNTDSVLFRAPGRINLLGEHTDYNDGFVLPASIDKEIVFAISKNGTNSTCNLYAFDLSESFSFDINNMSPNKMGWPNYIMGVVAEIYKNNKTISGFNLVFGGDIPQGAGLSSSAALESGMATALNEIYSLGFSKIELVKMAQMAEHNYAGVKCGIMDQFASVMGKANSAFQLDCRTLEYSYFPLELEDYQIILLDTKVKHELASTEYNTRRLECEEGVELIKQTHPKIINLRDVSLGLMHSYKDEMKHIIYNRCSYVVEENHRVVEATKALLNKDIKRVGELMYKTHEGLSEKYKVSCAELDFLVEQTKDLNYVAGARMMGGGFGGCTINLVKRNSIREFKMIMLNNYKIKFGIEAEAYDIEITDGCGNF